MYGAQAADVLTGSGFVRVVQARRIEMRWFIGVFLNTIERQDDTTILLTVNTSLGIIQALNTGHMHGTCVHYGDGSILHGPIDDDASHPWPVQAGCRMQGRFWIERDSKEGDGGGATLHLVSILEVWPWDGPRPFVPEPPAIVQNKVSSLPATWFPLPGVTDRWPLLRAPGEGMGAMEDK
jgi:hypothetical protein